MALSEDENWLLPENLARQEKEVVARIERGEDVSAGYFGAYHALLTGKDAKRVQAHAASGEKYLASYVRQLGAFLDGAGRHEELSALDVGCGPGMLTQKLHEGLPRCGAVGIDISESAIAYARKTYPACEFKVVSVDGKMDLGKKFDLVHAREFYPFTRTGDLDFHGKYVEVLAKHVAPRGALVITLLSRGKSLAQNADALAPVLGELGMTSFRRITIANANIPSWVPLFIARKSTAALLRLLGRDTVDFYVSRRKQAA